MVEDTKRLRCSGHLDHDGSRVAEVDDVDVLAGNVWRRLAELRRDVLCVVAKRSPRGPGCSEAVDAMGVIDDEMFLHGFLSFFAAFRRSSPTALQSLAVASLSRCQASSSSRGRSESVMRRRTGAKMKSRKFHIA